MKDHKIENVIKLIHKGNKREAILLIQEILKEDPKNEDAWLVLAKCLSDPNRKRFCIKKVLEINPENLEAHKLFYQIENAKIEKKDDDQNSINTNEEKTKSYSTDYKKTKKSKLLPISLFLLSLEILLIVVFMIIPEKTNFQIRQPKIVNTPTDTAEMKYVRQMEEKMKYLDSFETSLINWDRLMISVVPGEKFTYGEYLQHFYDTYYQIGKSYYDSGLEYDFEPSIEEAHFVLMKFSEEIINNGIILISEWDYIIPPQNLLNAHQNIISCANSDVKIFGNFVDGLKYYSDPISDVGEDKCIYLNNSIYTIKTFINEFKMENNLEGIEIVPTQ